MISPYYQEPGVTIYNCDFRDLFPLLSAEAIITDPVWPNSSSLLTGSEDPWGLFADLCSKLDGRTGRLVVQLGCGSDPRFLGCVPKTFPFLRVCWLRYVPPSYRGRVLVTSDVAYVFGEPPKVRPGAFIMPGECVTTRPDKGYERCTGKNKDGDAVKIARNLPHPAARRLQHVRWLVKWFGGASVIDPFAGSGTTAVACKDLGIPCVCIEIEEKYCELAVSRLKQGVLDLTEVEP